MYRHANSTWLLLSLYLTLLAMQSVHQERKSLEKLICRNDPGTNAANN
jgi:hypothetical protein